MAERPILMAPDMVRATLDGTKTMTRRLMKSQPFTGHGLADYKDDLGYPSSRGRVWAGFYHPRESGYQSPVYFKCPYGQPGDVLWVRETWVEVPYPAPGPKCRMVGDRGVTYRVDWKGNPSAYLWRPSIHMPRWAARIFLEVTDVRVERLQDISEEDARAEGFSTRVEFFDYWDSLAKDGQCVEDNPWVWPITYKRLEDYHG